MTARPSMRSLIDVRPGERRNTLLAMLFFFLLLTLYYLIRPVRDQLAGAYGLRGLALSYGAVLVCMLLLTPVYGWLVARLPRRRFIPLVYGFFTICLGFYGLWFSAVEDSLVRATSFFVWLSVFNLFVIAVFWSFMADLFNPEQSARLFPLIAIGGSAGSLVGPLLTTSLVSQLGIGGLLLIGAVLLMAALACAWVLLRADHSGAIQPQAAAHEGLIGGSILAGAKLVFRNPVIASLAAMMLFSDIIGGVIYAVLADHVKSLDLSPESRTQLYSTLDLRTNSIALALQLLVARPLLHWLGAGRTFALALAVNVVVCLVLAVLGDPAFALIALMVTRASAYGIQKPLLDGFYSRVDRESRYKAKAFIDTVIWRFGDLAVVLGMNGLAMAGVATLSKLGVAVYGMIAAASATGSGVLGWTVERWTRPALEGVKPRG